MKKIKSHSDKKNHLYLFLRYLILFGLMFSLPLIYWIFTPLTIYPTAGLLKSLYDISILNNIITINSITIQIIPACVAGSAYLLLLILNLTTPMNYKKRILSILLSFVLLLIINILRIFLLVILMISSSDLFDLTHKLFWYFLSTIFVIGIWFFIIKIFSIKKIPLYSDIRFLMKNIRE